MSVFGAAGGGGEGGAAKKDDDKKGTKSIAEIKREQREKQELAIRRGSLLQGQAFMRTVHGEAGGGRATILKKGKGHFADMVPIKVNAPWYIKIKQMFIGGGGGERRRGNSCDS